MLWLILILNECVSKAGDRLQIWGAIPPEYYNLLPSRCCYSDLQPEFYKYGLNYGLKIKLYIYYYDYISTTHSSQYEPIGCVPTVQGAMP